MTIELSDARRTLADAQAELRAASAEQAKVHAHREKLLDVGRRHTDLRRQLEQAQQAHSQALVAWAGAGAEGDAPPAPAAIEKLAKDVAAAERSASAADQAARDFQGEIDKAAQVCAQALDRLRAARREVLAEVAVPLIAAYRDSKASAEALLQHIFGLQFIARELAVEVPSIGTLTGSISAAMNFHPALVPGGAQHSRDCWKKLVADLFDDATAELGPAPNVIDAAAPVQKAAAA